MFKHATIFTFGDSFKLELDELRKLVTRMRFNGISETEELKIGFLPALGFDVESDEDFICHVDNYILLSFMKATKKVPADELNAAVAKRMREISPDAPLAKEHKEQIKDAVHQELIKRQQPKYDEIKAFIDIKEGLFVVNTRNTGDADKISVFFASSIGVKPSHQYVESDPTQIIADWLTLAPLNHRRTLPDWLALDTENFKVMGDDEQVAQVRGGAIATDAVLGLSVTESTYSLFEDNTLLAEFSIIAKPYRGGKRRKVGFQVVNFSLEGAIDDGDEGYLPSLFLREAEILSELVKDLTWIFSTMPLAQANTELLKEFKNDAETETA